MFQSVQNLLIMHYGMQSADYSVMFAVTVLPYFIFFTYFEYHRLSHKQHKNIFKIEIVDGENEVLKSVELNMLKKTGSLTLRTAKT